MISVCARIREKLGDRTLVRVAASGPLTLASKLAGMEALIICLAMEEPSAMRLLSYAAAIAEEWCRVLRKAGLDAIIFDSAAAPP